jgi:hypothetical protein
MKPWLVRLGLLGAIAVAGVWAWRGCFPSPEKAIASRLRELARVASFAPNEGPLAKMLNSEKLAGFFTGDVQVSIEVAGALHTLEGREQLRNAALNARSLYAGLTVEFPGMDIAVLPDRQSAEVELTAEGKPAGGRDLEVYELKFSLKKIGAEWLIRQVKTLKTLK